MRKVNICTKYDYNAPFIPQVGLMYVRGCEIEGMLDNEGKVIEEGEVINVRKITNAQNIRCFIFGQVWR